MDRGKIAIVLNGPPGCGKDTIAEHLSSYGFTHCTFKEQLYIMTAEHFGMRLEEFKTLAADREQKEVRHDDLILEDHGISMSPREALIHVSEDVIKPVHGYDYFGAMAANACMEKELSHVVFSDSGFEPEFIPIMELFEHSFVFRLHREGYNFDSDSRNYLADGPHVSDIDLIEGQPTIAVETILQRVFVGTQ